MTDQAVTNDNLTVPEKYRGKTTEEVIQMHQALERKLGERQAPQLPAELTAGPKTDPADVGKSAEAKASAKVAAALDALIHGRADAEKLLVELNVPAETARAALGISEGAQMKYVGNVYKAAGGKDAYGEMIRWAGESPDVTDYERESLMAEIESQQPSRVFIAVKALKERFTESQGYEPAQLVTAVPGGEAKRVVPFLNNSERMRAFADKRYNTDGAYTAEIQARAKVSDLDRHIPG